MTIPEQVDAYRALLDKKDRLAEGNQGQQPGH